jgi:hypothetical protein
MRQESQKLTRAAAPVVVKAIVSIMLAAPNKGTSHAFLNLATLALRAHIRTRDTDPPGRWGAEAAGN